MKIEELSSCEFQIKLIALLARNYKFLQQYRESLDTRWFTRKDLRILAESLFDWFDRYRKPVTLEDLYFTLSQHNEFKEFTPEQWQEVFSEIRRHQENTLDEVYEHVTRYIELNAYRQAIMTAVELIERGHLERIPEVLRKAERWIRHSDNYVSFFDDLDFWSQPDLVVRDTIPTGISDLDEIMDGGTARGELTVVLARYNVGKTTTLINFGTSALRHGHTVYHFHAEQTTSVIRTRYAACILDRNYSDVLSDPERTVREIVEFREKTGSSLIIADCAGWSISQIRGFIYKHGYPDVLIIDYADKLSPQKGYVNRWDEIGVIYNEMIFMAKEFNCSVMTASQVNREGDDKALITARYAAGAYSKAMDADNVLSLNQTEEEHEEGKIRIYIDKLRNQEKAVSEIPCRIIRKRMRIMSERDYIRSLEGKVASFRKYINGSKPEQ